MFFCKNRSARVRIASWIRSWELPGEHGILRIRLEMASYEAKSSRMRLRAAVASLLGGESELGATSEFRKSDTDMGLLEC